MEKTKGKKLTSREKTGLVGAGVIVLILSLSIGLGVFYGTSTTRIVETSSKTSIETTEYDSSKLYKFNDENKGSDVTSEYIAKSSLTNNGIYKYTTSSGIGTDVKNSYIDKSTLNNNGIYKYTVSSGIGTDVKNSYIDKSTLSNNALYKYSTTTGIGVDVQNDYIRKGDIFLVQTQESAAINSGRGNGILVNLQDNMKIIKRHYRIYDSETSTGPSVGFFALPNNRSKTLYLTAAVASTTTNNFELTSTSTESGNWIGLVELTITNTNGVLSGKFFKAHLGNSGDSNITNNFAAFSPKRIRENVIDPGDTTVNDRAVWFNGQTKTPAGRVAVDIPADTLSFLFKKLT